MHNLFEDKISFLTLLEKFNWISTKLKKKESILKVYIVNWNLHFSYKNELWFNSYLE